MAIAEQAPPVLRDVPGPSALGGSRRRALDLLYVIAVNDFKRTYHGTVLGYLWSIARPLIQFAVLLAVFTHVFHFASEVAHYPVFLLFNIVVFGFFQEATMMAVGSIVGHEAIVRKTQFPRLIILLAVVVHERCSISMLNLVVTFVFILAFGVVYPVWTWLLELPVVLALMLVSDLIAGIDDRLRAVPALPGRRRSSGRCLPWRAAALRHPGPVSDPGGVTQLPRPDRAQPTDTDHGPGSRRWVTEPSTPWPWAPEMGGPVRLAIAVTLYATVCVFAVLGLPPGGAAHRRGALSVRRGGRGGGEHRAGMRAIAISVTAGICQSQSSGLSGPGR